MHRIEEVIADRSDLAAQRNLVTPHLSSPKGHRCHCGEPMWSMHRKESRAESRVCHVQEGTSNAWNGAHAITISCHSHELTLDAFLVTGHGRTLGQSRTDHFASTIHLSLTPNPPSSSRLRYVSKTRYILPATIIRRFRRIVKHETLDETRQAVLDTSAFTTTLPERLIILSLDSTLSRRDAVDSVRLTSVRIDFDIAIVLCAAV